MQLKQITKTSDVPRINCDCQECRTPCSHMPGYLSPEDLVNFTEDQLEASSGAVVIKDGERVELPTLVPKQREDGTCIFLTDDGCSIHGWAPYGCRTFTVCNTWNDDAFEREVGLMEIYNDKKENGPYSRTVEKLKNAGQNARFLSERLTNFQNALMELER